MITKIFAACDGSEPACKAGFFERLLVGSVSKQVVTHAPCPVLVVR